MVPVALPMVLLKREEPGTRGKSKNSSLIRPVPCGKKKMSPLSILWRLQAEFFDIFLPFVWSHSAHRTSNLNPLRGNGVQSPRSYRWRYHFSNSWQCHIEHQRDVLRLSRQGRTRGVSWTDVSDLSWRLCSPRRCRVGAPHAVHQLQALGARDKVWHDWKRLTGHQGGGPHFVGVGFHPLQFIRLTKWTLPTFPSIQIQKTKNAKKMSSVQQVRLEKLALVS